MGQEPLRRCLQKWQRTCGNSHSQQRTLRLLLGFTFQKNPSSITPSVPGHGLIQEKIDRNVCAMTDAQGGFDWHIMRAGCCLVTSTLACGAVRAFRQHLDQVQLALRQGFKVLSAETAAPSNDCTDYNAEQPEPHDDSAVERDT